MYGQPEGIGYGHPDPAAAVIQPENPPPGHIVFHGSLLVHRLANTLAFERRCIRSCCVVPHMPISNIVSAVEGTPGCVFRPGVGRSLRRT